MNPANSSKLPGFGFNFLNVKNILRSSLLSLENSLCDDYITEKFFNVLQNYNTVPVVMGPKKEVNIFSRFSHTNTHTK
jgi:hypothetical protein